jgi:hypothetical protein
MVGKKLRRISEQACRWQRRQFRTIRSGQARLLSAQDFKLRPRASRCGRSKILRPNRQACDRLRATFTATEDQQSGRQFKEDKLSPASKDGRGWNEPLPNSAVVKLYRKAIWGIHGPFIPILRPNVARIIYPRSRRLTNFIDEIEIPIVLGDKS